MSVEKLVLEIAREAGRAAGRLRSAGRPAKDAALEGIARRLSEKRASLFEANAEDLVRAREKGLPRPMLARLTLDEKVLGAVIAGVRDVAALPDPVGEVTGMWRRPNGLLVGRMRIPLGVIGFIYESRPNVTVDAAALCLKSGNAVILKGGSEAIHTNLALTRICEEAVAEAGLPPRAIQCVPSTEREAVTALISLEDHLDLVIPRGGEGLIRFVTEHSRVPVLKHYKGVCHVYVDASADLGIAEEICHNAKVQKPGVCNAMETLLVHREVAEAFLPRMAARLGSAGVELRGCPRTREILPSAVPASEEDWPAEFLDLILAVRVVSDMEEAMAHIETHGSNHTETIVTQDYSRAQRFLAEVDSSVVLVNASTRFSDGFELGLGAEIGISTTKLHAFGPMGLEELTTTKFIVYGQGQVRG